MSKSLNQMCKNMSFSIKGGYKPQKISNIHDHLQELGRGCGSPRPKKGKGSYTRKDKSFRGYSN